MLDETKVTAALGVYLKCLQRRERAEDNVQEALAQLRGAAETSTFELKEQWYQIRERKGRLYLCELDGKPKGRPKKTPEQKDRDRIERERAKALESRGAGDRGDDAGEPGSSEGGNPGAAVLPFPGRDLPESGEHEIPIESDEEGPSLGDEEE
jgi:hypothetical protein